MNSLKDLIYGGLQSDEGNSIKQDDEYFVRFLYDDDLPERVLRKIFVTHKKSRITVSFPVKTIMNEEIDENKVSRICEKCEEIFMI